MDIATILGLFGAFGVVGYAMSLGGEITLFMNLPSLLIVCGGTVFAVLTKFGLEQFFGASRVIVKAFRFKLDTPQELIEQVVELADVARKGGLLSLEGKEVDNEFLSRGLQLLVDGHDPDVVRTLLNKDLSQTTERHNWGRKIFEAFGDVAPAMGMIGTLIGLVAMLTNMSDPKSIGPSMAIALLTTLYGTMIANMFAHPMADKLGLRCAEEGQIKSLIIDALLAIQSGQNPRVIESMLKTYLPERERASGVQED
jgi:chemotaxis protein MotA